MLSFASLRRYEGACVGPKTLPTFVAGPAGAVQAECAVLPQGSPLPPRFYFWLRGHDLAQAMHGLGKLKSYLRRPQSLAKRAGVPQRKLAEIGNWWVLSCMPWWVAWGVSGAWCLVGCLGCVCPVVSTGGLS